MKTRVLFLSLVGLAGCNQPASPTRTTEVNPSTEQVAAAAGEIGSLPEFSALCREEQYRRLKFARKIGVHYLLGIATDDVIESFARS